MSPRGTSGTAETAESRRSPSNTNTTATVTVTSIATIQRTDVTPVTMVLLGTCVFSAAAFLTGSLHYKASEKALMEEGVPPAARRAALPLATRALAASTAGCAAIGGVVALGYTLLGGEYSEKAAVGSWSDVVESAKEGVGLVRKEFHRRLDARKDTPDHTSDHTSDRTSDRTSDSSDSSDSSEG